MDTQTVPYQPEVLGPSVGVNCIKVVFQNNFLSLSSCLF